MEITFSLDFFRKFFRIPQSVRLCWCIIVKDNSDDDEPAQGRLGVMICGKSEAINVAEREIVETGNGLPLSFSAYPAVMFDGDKMEFKTSNGFSIDVPHTYIKDLYSRSVYSE